MAEKNAETKSLDSKELLKELATNKVVVKFRERLDLEIISETKHYKLGQLISPQKEIGLKLIDLKIAKEVKQ